MESIERRPVKIALVVGLILVFVALLAAYRLYNRSVADSDQNTISEETDREMAAKDTAKDKEVASDDGTIVVEIPKPSFPRYKGQPVGLLNADAAIVKQIPPDRMKEYTDELLKLDSDLLKKHAEHSRWHEAASIKKFFNDFIGARDIWEYVLVVDSKDTAVFSNLGSLYAMHLPDYPKAEKYYLQAIAVNPALTPAILGLADLYKTFYKEKYAEVPTVIKKGLLAVPGDANLMIFLATYYKESGLIQEALKYYEESLIYQPDNQPVIKEVERLKTVLSVSEPANN